MKPIPSAILAVFLYASQNVILDKFMRGTSPFVMAGTVGLIVGTLSWLVVGCQLMLGYQVKFPAGLSSIALIVGCLFLFGADICYFNAYTRGNVSAVAITTIAILLPAFVVVIKLVIGDGWPSPREMIAWLLAAAAVWLVSQTPTHPPQ
ncbi:hypothetical protein HY523_01700 [Candidatus Berkelbacteria bacterium]|nr:hypothetical protein [Candidatus Berkelbacteria bacterium]